MPGRYDLGVATIGQLLDDPEARAIIDEELPGAADNPMVAMVRGMPAETVLAMAGAQVDTAAIEKVRRRLQSMD